MKLRQVILAVASICLAGSTTFAFTPFFEARIDYLLTSPVAVSVGDYDGDGFRDVMVVNGGDGTATMMRNIGDGNLSAIGTYATGINPSDMYSADFNGDGKPDLAVTKTGDNAVSILINTGGGIFAFAPEVSYGVGAYPASVCGGDFNGDGKLDLAVACFDSDVISVLRGIGDGTFEAAINYTTLPSQGGPWGVRASDFDLDGHVDLAVTNRRSYGTISILINEAGTGFAPPVESDLGGYNVFWDPQAIATADFDGDTHPDLAIANAHYKNIVIVLNPGRGTFGNPVTYPVVGTPCAIEVTDLNGDGKPDLAVAGSLQSISCLTNNGDGTFALSDDYIVGNSPEGIAVGDLDGDGRSEVVSANTGSGSISVFKNRGTGEMVDLPTCPVGSSPKSVCAADFNGDSKQDLAVVNYGVIAAWQGSVSVLIGNGDGTYADSVSYLTGTQSRSVTSGDFDGDGKPDLAVANGLSKNISILKNNGDGTFAAAVNYALLSGPNCVQASDLNGDGKIDLAASNGGKTSVLMNNGDGTFAAAVDYGNSGSMTSLCIVDLNKDGWPDIATTNSSGAGSVVVWTNNGDGTFVGGGGVAGIGLNSQSIASGDFDGDGRQDLAVPTYVVSGANNVLILRNIGGGSFSVTTYSVPSRPWGVCAVDLDGNGKPEVMVSCYGANVVSMLRNYGDGTFTLEAHYGVGDSPQGVVAVDLNGDGNKDLAVANWKGNNVSVMINKVVPTSCCIGTTGNTDGDPSGMVDISDISAIVDYLVSSLPMSPCFAENEVNRDGTIDISDLQALIDYLVLSLPLPLCP